MLIYKYPNHHTENRKDTKNMIDTWKVKNDLQLTISDFEKMEYLADSIYQKATPIEDYSTSKEKLARALSFYADRREFAICASLLMDTMIAIKNSLKEVEESIVIEKAS